MEINVSQINETDTIFVKDDVEIKTSMSNGHGADGYKYTVTKKRTFERIGKPRRFIILDLEHEKFPDIPYLLFVDSVYEKTFMTLMEEFHIAVFGNRKDLIEQNAHFLFEAPDNPENFVPSDLEYSEIIYAQDAHNSYELSSQDSFFCKETKENMFVQLHTYSISKTETVPDSLTALIMELGGVDKSNGEKNPDGGMVKIYKGRDIILRELEIFMD